MAEKAVFVCGEVRKTFHDQRDSRVVNGETWAGRDRWLVKIDAGTEFVQVISDGPREPRIDVGDFVQVPVEVTVAAREPRFIAAGEFRVVEPVSQ